MYVLLSRWIQTLFITSVWYGDVELLEGSNLVNVALGKKAYQSGTTLQGFASKAVDGGTSQRYTQGSCTHTITKTNAFWEVDLGHLYFIDHVTIYNRIDACCVERLRDVQLLIGETNTSYTLHGYHAGIVWSTYTFQLKHATVGKWVRITRDSSVSARLTLCEVQVFGGPYERYFRINRGQKGTGEIIRTLKTRTLKQCGFKCLKTNGCAAANFLEEDFGCELLSSKTTEPAATGTTVLTCQT